MLTIFQAKIWIFGLKPANFDLKTKTLIFKKPNLGQLGLKSQHLTHFFPYHLQIDWHWSEIATQKSNNNVHLWDLGDFFYCSSSSLSLWQIFMTFSLLPFAGFLCTKEPLLLLLCSSVFRFYSSFYGGDDVVNTFSIWLDPNTADNQQ